MSSSLNLSELQIDALREVASIGAGHAATALSRILGTRINLQVPSAEIVRFRDLDTRITEVIAAVHFDVRGEAPGYLVVLFDRANAPALVGEAKLKELGDVIASSYVSAIVQLTGARMIVSLPDLVYILDRAPFESFMPFSPDHEVFLIESLFFGPDVKISGHLMFIPETGSLTQLLAAFGVT